MSVILPPWMQHTQGNYHHCALVLALKTSINPHPYLYSRPVWCWDQTTTLSMHCMGRLRCLARRAIFDTVLVNVHKVEELWVASGGAGQQAVPSFAHQPHVGFGAHVAGDVLFEPRLHPGLEALVQSRAHLLM